MLRLQDVSLMRGVRVLYSHATLLANPGERIGLVGENGCGKSSLLAAILGEAPIESGEISAPSPENIGHVAQDIDTVDEVAIDWVLSGHAPLMAAKKALKEAHDDMSMATAHAALAELNEGAITAQAKIILHGLGFTEEMTGRCVKDFSGGWRNRLALARALMCPAELLLLDEPTNHLDLDSVIWLEAWLKRQHATTVIISDTVSFLTARLTPSGVLRTIPFAVTPATTVRLKRFVLSGCALRTPQPKPMNARALICKALLIVFATKQPKPDKLNPASKCSSGLKRSNPSAPLANGVLNF